MEALTMLKHWRGGGGGVTTVSAAAIAGGRPPGTVASTVLGPSTETDDDGDDFIDLEFSLPDEGEDESEETSDDETDEQRQLRCKSDRAISLSPSDDLFFKGRLLPLENNPRAQYSSSSSNSLLRSATKFRILMLRLKRSKAAAEQDSNTSFASSAAALASPKQRQHHCHQHYYQQQEQQKKLFPKFKPEEKEASVTSLFARDNSSKIDSRARNKPSSSEEIKLAAEEKRNNSKDVVQRYLNKIKPLYVRVSKRYGSKPRFSGPLSSSGRVGPTEVSPPAPPSSTPMNANKDTLKSQNTVSLQSGLKLVYQRLGKSRSGSAAVAADRSPPSLPRRRDDSLLQQQDGIQSAIAHCKRSFQAPKASPEYPSQLVRSNSDPGEGRADKNAEIDHVSDFSSTKTYI